LRRIQPLFTANQAANNDCNLQLQLAKHYELPTVAPNGDLTMRHSIRAVAAQGKKFASSGTNHWRRCVRKLDQIQHSQRFILPQ